LSDAELDLITAGTLNIGDSSSGTITVAVNVTRPAATNMQLVSGGDVVLSGGQVNTDGGSLLLDPGISPHAVKPTQSGIDVAASSVALGGDLLIAINGLQADTDYTQLNASGSINLAGQKLVLSGSFVPATHNSFVIVNNDGNDGIVGKFNGLDEGALINFNGRSLQITYAGGTNGNDVVLTAVNSPPVASAGNLPVIEDVASSGTLVATDSDSTTLTSSIVVNPAHGTVVVTNAATGDYTYTPSPGYTGPDSFTFKANDGESDSNTAVVSITVSAFVASPAVIIDNSSGMGYSETGTWKDSSTKSPAGNLGDLRYASPNATKYQATAYDNGIKIAKKGDTEFATADVDTATYTFTGLQPGTYQIAVSYQAGKDRATNASFTISGTGLADQTVLVNQKVAPNSFTTNTSGTTAWQIISASFGSISANGTITVKLTSAGANGYVIADAVRIEQVAPPEGMSQPAANPVSQTLSEKDLQSVAKQAIARWKATGLSSSQLAALNNIHFGVQSLPGGELAVRSKNVISIDQNAAGFGWYVDGSSKSDKAFPIKLTATEMEATGGSPAFGKMDLLTVVMHELGHVLGLGHTADTTNIMSGDFELGIRRIPHGSP
ncbi:MAG: choice-of-anchor domain, partial [Planctomycetaceae bacterium]|nr:choice-of-anchor domain [Planctomycetaceae bacterium]